MAFVLLNSRVTNCTRLEAAIKTNYLKMDKFNDRDEIDNFFTNNDMSSMVNFAFVFDNNEFFIPFFNKDSKYFSDDCDYFLQKLVEINPNIIVDMVTCSLNKSWIIDEIHNLSSKFNLTIRFSMNMTGNETDWILESHNIDIKDLYFNEKINQWNEILYYVAVYKPWTKQSFKDTNGNMINERDISSNIIDGFFDSSGFMKKFPAGKVSTWGNSTTGGVVVDISGVVGIQANDSAFAALRANGSVIVWGDTNSGGSINNDVDVTTNVVSICSTSSAFAALKADGSVVAWGDSTMGGSNPALTSVARLFATSRAFAALKTDGSVTPWGASTWGGVNAQGAAISSGVKEIYSNQYAFAALKTDGSVVMWGSSGNGGTNNTSVDLTSVSAVYSTNSAFAALKTTGEVVAWGDSTAGAKNSSNSSQIVPSGVTQIKSTSRAFAARKSDGTVVCWGDSAFGGTNNTGAVLTNVKQLFGNDSAFAALKNDGSVVTWGSVNNGGNSSSVASNLTADVISVYSCGSAFAAIKASGSVVVWGTMGGTIINTTIYTGAITNQIAGTTNALAAIRLDGAVALLGDPANGGSNNTSTDLSSNIVYICETQNAFAAIRKFSGTGDGLYLATPLVGKFLRAKATYTDNSGNLNTVYSNIVGPITKPNISVASFTSTALQLNTAASVVINFPDGSQNIPITDNLTDVADGTIRIVKDNNGKANIYRGLSFTPATFSKVATAIVDAKTKGIKKLLVQGPTPYGTTYSAEATYAAKTDISLNITYNTRVLGFNTNNLTNQQAIVAAIVPTEEQDSAANRKMRFWLKVMDTNANSLITSDFSLPFSVTVPDASANTLLLDRFADSSANATFSSTGIVLTRVTGTSTFTGTLTTNSLYGLGDPEPTIEAGGEGDPHITTYDGKKYDLPHVKGKFIFFDNQKPYDSLKIVAECDFLTNREYADSPYKVPSMKEMTFIKLLWINVRDSQIMINMNTLEVTGYDKRIMVSDIYDNKDAFKSNYARMMVRKHNIKFNGKSRDIYLNCGPYHYKVTVTVDLNCADLRNSVFISGPDIEQGFGCFVSPDHDYYIPPVYTPMLDTSGNYLREQYGEYIMQDEYGEIVLFKPDHSVVMNLLEKATQIQNNTTPDENQPSTTNNVIRFKRII